jgi:PHD/YefM family antitoxin component YafN of YafNO toxin-antitoxin module
VTISTKEGNVVLLSEDDYRSLIESLHLAGVKGVFEDIEEAVKTPTSEFSKDAPLK